MEGANCLKLLVAVDFGTTYSSVAWVSTRPQEQPHERSREDSQILTWWGEGVRSADSVPTVLHYGPGRLPGSRQFKWGYQIEASEDDTAPGTIYDWFKLALHANPDYSNSLLARRYLPGRPILDAETGKNLVVAYLTALRRNFDSFLSREGYSQDLRKRVPTQYIITVPAIWTDREKDLTQRCAAEAGMSNGNIRMIKEPEAASIYALQSTTRHNLGVGDCFVLCDAGGGTVDLISYTIVELTPTPILREAAAGSGGLCGSSFLNRSFCRYMERRFRDYPAFDEQLQKEAMKVFEERIKPSFTGTAGDNFKIRFGPGLPDSIHHSIRRGFFHIPQTDLLGIFREVTDEIVRLVRVQIGRTNATVKKVLLAGGFGSSTFLRSELQRAIDDANLAIKIIGVYNSTTSIVRGALLDGLTRADDTRLIARVDSRIATRSFGVLQFVQFDESKGHDPQLRVEDTRVGNGYLIEVMNWFITQGQLVRESKRVPVQLFSRQCASNGPVHPMEIDVYVHETHTTERPPQQVSSSTQRLIKLSVKLDLIPPAHISQERGTDGLMYHVAIFDIEATLDSANLLTFRLRYEGLIYDEDFVPVDFSPNG